MYSNDASNSTRFISIRSSFQFWFYIEETNGRLLRLFNQINANSLFTFNSYEIVWHFTRQRLFSCYARYLHCLCNSKPVLSIHFLKLNTNFLFSCKKFKYAIRRISENIQSPSRDGFLLNLKCLLYFPKGVIFLTIVLLKIPTLCSIH